MENGFINGFENWERILEWRMDLIMEIRFENGFEIYKNYKYKSTFNKNINFLFLFLFLINFI